MVAQEPTECHYDTFGKKSIFKFEFQPVASYHDISVQNIGQCKTEMANDRLFFKTACPSYRIVKTKSGTEPGVLIHKTFAPPLVAEAGGRCPTIQGPLLVTQLSPLLYTFCC